MNRLQSVSYLTLPGFDLKCPADKTLTIWPLKWLIDCKIATVCVNVKLHKYFSGSSTTANCYRTSDCEALNCNHINQLLSNNNAGINSFTVTWVLCWSKMPKKHSRLAVGDRGQGGSRPPLEINSSKSEIIRASICQFRQKFLTNNTSSFETNH